MAYSTVEQLVITRVDVGDGDPDHYLIKIDNEVIELRCKKEGIAMTANEALAVADALVAQAKILQGRAK